MACEEQKRKRKKERDRFTHKTLKLLTINTVFRKRNRCLVNELTSNALETHEKETERKREKRGYIAIVQTVRHQQND